MPLQLTASHHCRHRIRSMLLLFVAAALLATSCEIEQNTAAEEPPDQLLDAPPGTGGVERNVPDATTTAPPGDLAGELSTTTTTTATVVPAPTSTTAGATTVPPSTTVGAATPVSTTVPRTTTVPPTTVPATTVAPTTTAPATTTTTTTTSVPSGGGYAFATLPPGSTLPSGAWCATQVVPTDEHRPENATANATRGTSPNGRYPRVDGDFVGTTDEIIQWVACKWGIDVDIARAQSAKESWWTQSAGGDLTWDQTACHPDLRTGAGQQCPESTGLLQVRYLYHMEAFEDSNAILSTAYNADYTYAAWRDCYEGNLTWLNDVEHGAWYEAGDVDGCMGVWFTGRWYAGQGEAAYLAELYQFHDSAVWEQPWF